jgi:hypothetical protein
MWEVQSRIVTGQGLTLENIRETLYQQVCMSYLSCCPVIPAMWKAEVGRPWYRMTQEKNRKPYVKLLKVKRGGGMAQVIKCLLSKKEPLSANLIITKK